MADRLRLYLYRICLWRYPANRLRQDDPHGYSIESNTGTGFRDGNELPGHPVMPVYHQCIQRYAPHRNTTVRFHIQYDHCTDCCCLGLYQTGFVPV